VECGNESEGLKRKRLIKIIQELAERSNRNHWRDMEIDKREKRRLHTLIRGEQRVDVLVEGIKRSIE
jgi:hypothetical protein